MRLERRRGATGLLDSDVGTQPRRASIQGPVESNIAHTSAVVDPRDVDAVAAHRNDGLLRSSRSGRVGVETNLIV